MLWMILFLFANPPAHASAPIPDALRAKWQDVTRSVHQGIETARTKVDETGREEVGAALRQKVHAARQSSFVQSLGAAADRLWILAKSKGRGLLVSLDHELHARVLDEPKDGK